MSRYIRLPIANRNGGTLPDIYYLTTGHSRTGFSDVPPPLLRKTAWKWVVLRVADRL